MHVTDEPHVREVYLSLPEPYRSFAPQIYISNTHSANEAIRRAILDTYPEIDVEAVRGARVRPVRSLLSVATVSKEGGLHVSLHQEPPYVADPVALKERVGAALYFMENNLKASLIKSLRRLNVVKVYILTTNGLKTRKIIDLQKAERDLSFKPPEED
jgi:hypothetical protein